MDRKEQGLSAWGLYDLAHTPLQVPALQIETGSVHCRHLKPELTLPQALTVAMCPQMTQ